MRSCSPVEWFETPRTIGDQRDPRIVAVHQRGFAREGHGGGCLVGEEIERAGDTSAVEHRLWPIHHCVTRRGQAEARDGQHLLLAQRQQLAASRAPRPALPPSPARRPLRARATPRGSARPRRPARARPASRPGAACRAGGRDARSGTGSRRGRPRDRTIAQCHRPAVARNSAIDASSSPLTSVRVPTARRAERLAISRRSSCGDRSESCRYSSSSPDSSISIRAATVSSRSTPSPSALSRATTAAYDEIDWNWVTISENAPSRCENAIADWVITPNSAWPWMNSGATIRTGMIWIMIVVAGGEEAEVAIDGDDAPEVADQLVDAATSRTRMRSSRAGTRPIRRSPARG